MVSEGGADAGDDGGCCLPPCSNGSAARPAGRTSPSCATARGVECGSGHRFERRDGVLDFSRAARPQGSTERTFASFGYEWNAFDEVRGRGRVVRDGLLPRRRPRGAARQGRPRRRLRQGSLHPVPGRVPRGRGGPRRLVGGRGRGPQPGRLPRRGGRPLRPAGRPVRTRELRLHLQPRRPPPSRRPVRRVRAAADLSGAQGPGPALPLQPPRAGGPPVDRPVAAPRPCAS